MSKILVVDDELLTCRSLEEFLTGKGHEVITVTRGKEALSRFKAERPEVILLDIRMPWLDGLEVLREARALDEEVAVIMMSAVRELDVAISSMKMGAFDYVTKPVHLDALALAIERALERRRLLIENRTYRERLEEMVRERTRELQGAYGELKGAHLNAVKVLAEAIEAKDPYTRGHSARVCRLSLKIADRLGLSSEEKALLEYGCILHDVGKIGVRGAILNKDSSLTPEEYAHVQEHPVKGEKILMEVPFFHSILPIVRNHHERTDGQGYPDGLKGRDLSRPLKVIILADAFDAMRSDRPYRKARGLRETLAILRENAGSQFDPDVVRVFLEYRIYEEGKGVPTRAEPPARAEESPRGEDPDRR